MENTWNSDKLHEYKIFERMCVCVCVICTCGGVRVCMCLSVSATFLYNHNSLWVFFCLNRFRYVSCVLVSYRDLFVRGLINLVYLGLY